MNQLININEETETVSARDLHEALEIRERFGLWIGRYEELLSDYGLSPVGKPTELNNGRGTYVQDLEDYNLPLDLAKHICMMTKTEKGKECRQYFIDLEKAWNSPEQVMARALKVANQTIANLKIQTEEMKPKADYFDALVDKKLNLSFRDTAKELKVKETQFIEWLIAKKYIYRDAKRELKPYADRLQKGLFEVKEYNARYSDHAGTQTVITPKGRETFRLLLKGEE
ncbi:MAG: phage antirepressor KilAC domain-containing protein [Bacteroidales bacterium]|nr:phage antirepressor KilAC domain-containing protein [Bacteroidales bacterium]